MDKEIKSETKVETRAERSARRRAETLEEYHKKFAEFCDEEMKDKTLTPNDWLKNSIRKMDNYIGSLIKAKPQEQSFYISVALEWQRQKVAQMDAIVRSRK
jgi:hypothetical protein